MGCTSSNAANDVQSRTKVVAPPVDRAKLEEEKKDKKLQMVKEMSKPKEITSGDGLPDFTPNPGFVIKTKRTNTHQKIFINVMHHDCVPTSGTTVDFVTRGEAWKTDKKGEKCATYTAVLPTATYAAMIKDPTKQPEVSNTKYKNIAKTNIMRTVSCVCVLFRFVLTLSLHFVLLVLCSFFCCATLFSLVIFTTLNI